MAELRKVIPAEAFTAGPWESTRPIHNGYAQIDALKARPYPHFAFMRVVVQMGGDDAPTAEGIATVQMVVALPDLFEAAKGVLDRNGGPIDGNETDDGNEYVMVRRSDFDRLEKVVSMLKTEVSF